MEPEALDYPEALARLTAMIGQQVEVTVRGARSKPPIVADLEGVLQHTDQVKDAKASQRTADRVAPLSVVGGALKEPGVR